MAYLVRADVAVAQERMVPALGLTMASMGAITAWGFQLPYALFQVPVGCSASAFGAATALALTLLACSASSFITGLLPEGDAAHGDAHRHARAARHRAGRGLPGGRHGGR